MRISVQKNYLIWYHLGHRYYPERWKVKTYYGLNCVPPKDIEIPISIPPMSVNLFGSRVSADDQVKMRSLGWTLIQYDYIPLRRRKGKIGHRHRHIQWEDNVKTQRTLSTLSTHTAWNVWGYLKLGEGPGTDPSVRVPRRNQSCMRLDFRRLAYRTVRQCISVV